MFSLASDSCCSAGVRNCIGQRYAMMSAKTLSATILRRFRVLPALMGPQRLEDIKFVVGISVAVHGGAPILLQNRARSVSSRPG